jgi:fructokinase
VGLLLLGEALVDLVCERPVAGLAEAQAFVAHPGGGVANVASVAAREGAQVALAGGAGDDEWGAWLRGRLEADGVDLRWFALHEGVQTPVAFVTVDRTGEPVFHVYGQERAATMPSRRATRCSSRPTPWWPTTSAP